MSVPISLVLVLHHPPLRPADEHGGPLLERFCEHVVEGVLPLMRLLQHTPAPVTVALSQPWMEMMERPSLCDAVEAHLRQKLVGYARFAEEHQGTSLAALAEGDGECTQHALDFYCNTIDRDVVGALAEWFEAGRVELIPVAGSHALLPLLCRQEMRTLHLRSAARAFEQRFGSAPRGVWLPECAVGPEVLDALVESQSGAAVVEGWLLDEQPAARLGEGAALLGRHSVCSTWPQAGPDSRSSSRGLDGRWGWTALGEEGARERRVYDRQLGEQSAREAGRATLEAVQDATVLAWSVDGLAQAWFEWPEALAALVAAGAESELVSWVALSAQEIPVADAPLKLENTSWHRDGLGPWLAPSNGWLIRHLHRLERRACDAVAGRHRGGRPLPPWQRRAVQVALREVMMAQSSDLAMAMEAASGVEHALSRARGHVATAVKLLDMVEQDNVDKGFVEAQEEDMTLAALVDLELLRPSS